MLSEMFGQLISNFILLMVGKSTLHATTDFQSLPSYVQRHLAVGQSWPEGDVAFHRKISVPTLLVHGLKDRFVSLVEMCEMERVRNPTSDDAVFGQLWTTSFEFIVALLDSIVSYHLSALVDRSFSIVERSLMKLVTNSALFHKFYCPFCLDVST